MPLKFAQTFTLPRGWIRPILGTVWVVLWRHHDADICGFQWTVSTTFGLISMNIHVPLMMNCNVFGNHQLHVVALNRTCLSTQLSATSCHLWAVRGGDSHSSQCAAAPERTPLFTTDVFTALLSAARSRLCQPAVLCQGELIITDAELHNYFPILLWLLIFSLCTAKSSQNGLSIRLSPKSLWKSLKWKKGTHSLLLRSSFIRSSSSSKEQRA